MQSVCLDEFGGEKAVRPIYQETNFIQHIFGGHLQFQVICAECSNVSIQLENMMDLTVEIHGDAGSLEEYLDQFTTKERLHGVNMYKCDGVWALQDERVFYHHRRLLESKLLDLIRMLLED